MAIIQPYDLTRDDGGNLNGDMCGCMNAAISPQHTDGAISGVLFS